MPVCKSGEIKRASYTRKAYTRKDGVRVKAVRVASGCIVGTGTGLKVIPKLVKGELKQFGYAASGTVRSRHIALGKAIKEYGQLSVFRKLNALAVLNKNRAPSTAAIFRADTNWIKEKYRMGKSPAKKSPAKKSPSKKRSTA